MSRAAVFVPPRSLAAPRPRGLSSYLWLTGAHALLVVVLKLAPAASTLHALGALAYGLVAVFDSRDRHRALYAAAYICGAETLWRMTEARVFWEYGKYAVTLLLGLYLLRGGMRKGLAPLAVLYFGLMIPGCLLTIQQLGFSERARQMISSNLSGPLALAVAVIFFSSFKSGGFELDRLVGSILWPIAGIFFLVLYSTLTATELAFSAHSNFATSGGFGPNQVSAILGLGSLLALLLALHAADRPSRWFLLAICGALLVQAIMTFSRGGVFNALICFGLIGLHYVQQGRMRGLLLGSLIVLVLVGSQLILPRLNRWTQGTLGERYSSIDTTGRQEIAEADLKVWRDHPVLGAGAGMSGRARRRYLGKRIAAHTEYTRLLAEHGLLGAASLLVLLLIAGQAYLRAPSLLTKGWVAAMAGWTFASMAHMGMRIAVISFLFGLAAIRWPRPPPSTQGQGSSERAGQRQIRPC